MVDTEFILNYVQSALISYDGFKYHEIMIWFFLMISNDSFKGVEKYCFTLVRILEL